MSGRLFGGMDPRLEGTAGLTGVWAEENTRESIFNAMLRKETFAVSGPHIKVRFFGGWNYAETATMEHEALLLQAPDEQVDTILPEERLAIEHKRRYAPVPRLGVSALVFGPDWPRLRHRGSPDLTRLGPPLRRYGRLDPIR
jgi:hypothetical protein